MFNFCYGNKAVSWVWTKPLTKWWSAPNQRWKPCLHVRHDERGSGLHHQARWGGSVSFLGLRVCQSVFVSKAGSCTWNAHAARLPDARSAPSASWGSSLWPESICKSRSAPQPESLGWSAPILSPRSSARHHQTARSWTEMTDFPPSSAQTDPGQTSPGSGRPLQSHGCLGCCTLHSSLWGSGSPETKTEINK